MARLAWTSLTRDILLASKKEGSGAGAERMTLDRKPAVIGEWKYGFTHPAISMSLSCTG